MCIILKEDNLQQIITGYEKVIVLFDSVPVQGFEQLAQKYSDINFVFADGFAFPNAKQLAHVRNLPSVVAFKNGAITAQVETHDVNTIERLVDELV